MDQSDQIAHVLQEKFGDKELVGAEIGVHHGVFSGRLLKKCPTLVHYYMIDTWAGFCEGSRYAESMRKFGGDIWTDHEKMKKCLIQAQERTAFAASRRIILRGTSQEWAVVIPDWSLDFVYIDADHTRQGCFDDLCLWYHKVRKGGVVAGHDWNAPAAEWGVREAVEKYVHICNLSVEVETGAETTWWFFKE